MQYNIFIDPKPCTSFFSGSLEHFTLCNSLSLACLFLESKGVSITMTLADVFTTAVTIQAERSTEALPMPPASASPIVSTTTNTSPVTNPTMATLPQEQSHPTTPLDIQGS